MSFFVKDNFCAIICRINLLFFVVKLITGKSSQNWFVTDFLIIGGTLCQKRKKPKYYYEEPGETVYCDDHDISGAGHCRIAAGIPLAIRKKAYGTQFVGIPQNYEWHTIIFGGSGSGKSTGPVMAALNTWKGGMIVTDPKGELYSYYERLLNDGIVQRKALFFDPTNGNSIRFDPFWWIAKDGEDNLMDNIIELVHSIIPMPTNCREPYWVETEQTLLEAGILHFYRMGLNFSEAMIAIVKSPLEDLIRDISNNGDCLEKIILGSIADLKTEELASHDRGLRNKLLPFVASGNISEAFNSTYENPDCFVWDSLREYNIFIRIPEERIEQWSAPIRMMLKQLFRYLERRPDEAAETNCNPVLLLLDEFARFGKIEGIANALCTLRSKNVNIVLALQSLAQLDKHYGIDERRIICDNCPYKLVLQACDTDTQKYLSELIGVHKVKLCGKSRNMDAEHKITGYGKQSSEAYLPRIFPHKFSTLKGAVLISPFGIKKLKKIYVYHWDFHELLMSDISTVISSEGY